MKAVRDAIYARLMADGTVQAYVGSRIFWQYAPEGAAMPYVIFFKSAGTPTYTLAARAFVTEVYTVKAVAEGDSPRVAEQAAEAIDAALDDAPLNVSGRTLMVCRKQSDMQFPERDAGRTIHHVGQLWEIATQ